MHCAKYIIVLKKPTIDLKRLTYTIIFSLAWVGGNIGWFLAEYQNTSSWALRFIFVVSAFFHPTAILMTWRKIISLQKVNVAIFCYGIFMNVATMALAFYGPYNETIAIDTLYLWVPVIYIFAFASFQGKAALRFSAIMWAFLLLVSLPMMFQFGNSQYLVLTLQMHLMSVAFIAALFFFASFQQRLRVAELSVDEMAKLANTDELTQVANRRLIDEVMKHELLRYMRYDHAFSIIIFDIDHFKKVNDNFGHDIGDRILIALAQKAKEVLREVDTLGRWGGEEFIMVLPETEFEEALSKAEQLRVLIDKALLVDDHQISLSCGVTQSQKGDSVERVFKRADDALYNAKRNGRNRVEGFSDEESNTQASLEFV